jgi:hypothetical protein
MKVQIVTPYRVSHLQRYGVTVRGKVTSVYPALDSLLCTYSGTHLRHNLRTCPLDTLDFRGKTSNIRP